MQDEIFVENSTIIEEGSSKSSIEANSIIKNIEYELDSKLLRNNNGEASDIKIVPQHGSLIHKETQNDTFYSQSSKIKNLTIGR